MIVWMDAMDYVIPGLVIIFANWHFISQPLIFKEKNIYYHASTRKTDLMQEFHKAAEMLTTLCKKIQEIYHQLKYTPTRKFKIWKASMPQ